MGSSAVQMACVVLGVMGLIGIVVACILPRWRVSSFIGSNIVTAQVRKGSRVMLKTSQNGGLW